MAALPVGHAAPRPSRENPKHRALDPTRAQGPRVTGWNRPAVRTALQPAARWTCSQLLGFSPYSVSERWAPRRPLPSPHPLPAVSVPCGRSFACPRCCRSPTSSPLWVEAAWRVAYDRHVSKATGGANSLRKRSISVEERYALGCDERRRVTDAGRDCPLSARSQGPSARRPSRRAPTRRRRGDRALTRVDRFFNTVLARTRVRVEHGIGCLKRWRCRLTAPHSLETSSNDGSQSAGPSPPTSKRVPDGRDFAQVY